MGRDGNAAVASGLGAVTSGLRAVSSAPTQDTVLEVRNCIRTGAVFGLDYPADAFDPGMSHKRSAPRRTIYSSHPAHRDDYLDG